jgi:hypothetical protein
MEMGPVWALAIMGADMAPAATATPLRRLRRREVWGCVKVISKDGEGIKRQKNPLKNDYAIRHILGAK